MKELILGISLGVLVFVAQQLIVLKIEHDINKIIKSEIDRRVKLEVDRQWDTAIENQRTMTITRPEHCPENQNNHTEKGK